jgi:hypothetical protein
MAARETEIRSLEWIGTIRAAQEQYALQAANQAAVAAGAATAAQIEVEKRCELALAEWDIAVSQGAQFDPGVAAIWAHELSVSDAQLVDANRDTSAREDERVVASADWQQAVVRANRVADDLAAARRKVASRRLERHISMLADLAVLKHTKR